MSVWLVRMVPTALVGAILSFASVALHGWWGVSVVGIAFALIVLQLGVMKADEIVVRLLSLFLSPVLLAVTMARGGVRAVTRTPPIAHGGGIGLWVGVLAGLLFG